MPSIKPLQWSEIAWPSMAIHGHPNLFAVVGGNFISEVICFQRRTRAWMTRSVHNFAPPVMELCIVVVQTAT